MIRSKKRPSIKRRGHLPLPSVVMSRSSGSRYHHGDEYQDHLILNSSDEDESDHDEENVKTKDIDTEDTFPATNCGGNGEHEYEDAN